MPMMPSQYQQWHREAFEDRVRDSEPPEAENSLRRCKAPTEGDELGPLIVEAVLQKGKSVVLVSGFRRDDLTHRPVQGVLHWSIEEKEELLIEGLKSTADLNHPGLVNVHEVCRLDAEWGNCLLEVREALPPSIALRSDYGLRKPVPAPAAVTTFIGSKIAEILAYLHSRNQVHGSLRPRRVYCLLEGILKLDGVHEHLERMQGVLPHKSALLYRAPEVDYGRPESLSRASDIFSLGAILFELATGKLAHAPPEGKSWDEVLDSVSHAPLLERLNEVEDAALRQVLACALQPNPEHRYPKAEFIGAALDMLSKTTYDVFISVRSRDFDTARQIARLLQTKGLSVFLSDESLPRMGDAQYRRAIDIALAAAKNMIVITTSPGDLETGWVDYEWTTFDQERLAERKQGNLVFLLADRMNAAMLPIGARRNQALMLSQPNLLDQLLHYLARG